MIRRLTRALEAATRSCPGCGGWYNPADPDDWANHKHC